MGLAAVQIPKEIMETTNHKGMRFSQSIVIEYNGDVMAEMISSE